MPDPLNAVPQRLVAALADRYSIEREIGLGGTATVYLAEDLKHHRRVAIKVLKPQVAAALGPERFEDEVRIAANLHHPHILAVHDSGEADGFLYYVMPYVAGHSLRESLDEGLMSFPKVAKVLAEVADALAYAHAAGIVHRDIKPENILHNGKHIVVTDFGIAKAISEAADRKSSTSLGIALGTPAYMAPEQAASDATLDARADLYSLGVVGYELLTGSPPFSGSAQQMLTAHITTKPEPIATRRPGVPPGLASVVMRALAKAPGDRWPSAEAMQAQLEPLAGTTSNSGMMATVAMRAGQRGPGRKLGIGVGAALLLAVGVFAWQQSHAPATSRATSTVPATGASTAAAPAGKAAVNPNAIPDLATDPSIAVLPFDNMSADKDQVYFSDGISEELLNLLAKVPKLRVIARTSSFAFKGKEVAIPEIARALNVAAILEGSVRKSSDTVRITVQLIRARDSSHLWSETYDRKLDDIFKVQDEIAARVVAQLKIKLLGAAPTSKVIDPKAYALFLQAREVSRQNSTMAYEQSISLYEQALAIDPGYTAAWVGLAGTYSAQFYQYVRPAGEAIPPARAAITKALAIDPDFAPAHAQIGWIDIFYDRDLAAAARHLERALALDPSNTDVLNTAASLARRLGRLEQSISISEYLLARDPVNAAGYDDLGFAYLYAGRQNDSVAAFRTVLRLSPSYAGEHANLAWVFLVQGDAKAGMLEAQQETDPQLKLFALAVGHFALGQKALSDAILADAIKRYRTTSAINIAAVYAFRGEADQTFEWLDKALQNHEPDVGAVPALKYFANLKSDPRWLPFLRKAGMAPEQLAKVSFKVDLPK